MTSSDAGLAFRDVHKSFGGAAALRGVSFSVAEGEAHALVGENGAGKSTLLKILTGVVAPDRGELAWQGRPLRCSGPRDALRQGIGSVHQEMLSFPNLSVSANVFAGHELVGRGGRLRQREMRERTRELLARLHLPLLPDQPMESLSAAHRQLVQVARALAFDCRLLVLDEPTTSLTGAETDHLFRILEDLRQRGVTLLYVSHRLPEVFRLCERITVLRDGQHVGTFARSDTVPDRIIQAMVGRELTHAPAASKEAAGATVLRLSGYTRRPCFEDVSFLVKAGEVVGLFGLVGAGRSELLETIFGIYSPDGGTLELDGRPLRAASPRQAARAGIALAPEERQRQGLFFNLSLRHNLVLPREAARGAQIVRHLRERRDASALVAEWGIRTASLEVTPDTLSGGNQQKVVLAKWLATRPRLLMLDEPTKGVDVGAKYDIHQVIRRQAAEGAGCLVASSDLPEVLSLCDRIVVMRRGRVQGEVRAGAASEESVMRLAAGEAVAC